VNGSADPGPWPPPDRAAWPQPPLPPRPVHHEPGDAAPRPAESPWRRSQRLSRPEVPGVPGVPGVPEAPAAPLLGQPVTARHDYEGEPAGGFRQPGPEEFPAQGQYRQYPEEDDQQGAGRFLPGFTDDGFTDDGFAADDGFAGEGGFAGEAGAQDEAEDRAARPGRGGRRPPRRPRRRRFRWLAPLAAVLVIVVPLAVGGSYAYSFYMSRYHPPDYTGQGTGRVVVQVSSGDTPTSLAPKLQRLGVVASTRAFVLAAEHSQNASGLVPGFYGLRKHMNAALAYAALLNPRNLVQITVTIPEGLRVSEVVSRLGAKSGIPASAYASVLKNPAQLHLPGYANGNPEGYLFPATYEVLPHETALGVLTGMVQRFDQEAASVSLPAAAAQVHLSPAQVIIMASLVQAEGGRITDYPSIARVIDNRLARGMPLQLDSTVLYGLHKFGFIASDADLAIPTPYNTYKNKGLPPGPIDSPGDAAIKAVLHPASGPWLYFVTVNPKTGETRFTSSFAQFEQFRAELEHNLGQG
jgi:UPF0755 protein